VIRPARTIDVEMLVRWRSDPEVALYWDGKTYTREKMRARLADEHLERWLLIEFHR